MTHTFIITDSQFNKNAQRIITTQGNLLTILYNLTSNRQIFSIQVYRGGVTTDSWIIDYQQKLTDSDMAFMESFKSQCNQYDVTDKQIIDYLLGEEVDCFEGYTQLADAYNMWRDALRFSESNSVVQ